MMAQAQIETRRNAARRTRIHTQPRGAAWASIMTSKKLCARVTTLLLVGALTFPAMAAITFDFDDGTLQGWTTVSDDPLNAPDPTNYASVSAQAGISPQGGTKYVMCQPSGGRDNAHKTLWIRSPQFMIDQAGSLTLYLAGGTGLGGWPGTLATMPTNAADIPLGVDSTMLGVLGVALRDTANGDFVLTAQRTYSDAAWTQIVWDVSAYLNNGRTYTLELFDYHSGNGWSHLSMDTVSIPATLEPVPFVDITNATGTVVAPVGATSFTLVGTNNDYTVGNLWWSNTLMGVAGIAIPSGIDWSFDATITNGINVVTVYGSNTAGLISEDAVTIVFPAPPAISNEAAHSVRSSSAVARGNLLATNHAPTTVWLYHGPADGGVNPGSWATVTNLDVLGIGQFDVPLSGLPAGSPYYFRFYATNDAGVTWADTSESFTTKPAFDAAGYTNAMWINFIGYTNEVTLLNFPALIVVSNGTQAGAVTFDYTQFLTPPNYDLRFADSYGNEMNYEIDTWDTNGQSFIWVQVPLMQLGAGVVMYWGKAGVAQPDYSTNGATWSEGYMATWHMTNKWVTDSTGRGNDATAVQEWDPITEIAGAIGTGLRFPDSAGGGMITTKNIVLTKQTLSAWVWSDNLNDHWGTMMTKDDMWFMANVGTTYRFETTPWGNDYQPQIPSSGAWHYVVATAAGDGAYDGRYQAIYVDGELKGSWTKDGIPGQNGNSIRIGAAGQDNRTFQGNLDELRMANVPRSPEWIWAEYNNQRAPAVFAEYLPVPEPFAAGAAAVIGYWLLVIRRRS